ncbi:hypothetical protein Tco_1084644 [Tanacetum coccineum]
MSTPANFNSKIISQTVGGQSSRVPTPLPDDPYVAVRAPLTDEEFEDRTYGRAYPADPSTFKVGQSSRSVPEHEGAERIFVFRQPTLVIWTLPSLEWSSSSLPISPSSPAVPSPIASPVTTLAATISVDEDHFLEVGAQLELYGSILHDHTQRLDALPPTLFEGYDQDLRELYTSAIWRPVLALEAWAGQTNAHRAALWHAIYDIQRENQDLRRQIAEKRRERLELTDRVARIERRQESRGE